MISKKKLIKYLDTYLDINKFKDYATNGLQIDGKEEIKKIGFTVDASLEAFKIAKKNECDMLICHHGLFWNKIGPITKLSYNRIQTLIKNDISLYAAHAPLDIHKIVGNNSQLLKKFNLKPKKEFGQENDTFWGYKDSLKNPITLKQAIEIIKTFSNTIQTFDFGKKEIKNIAAVSGGASFTIPQAIDNNIDLLIIGEIKHNDFHTAKEGKLNVIAAGHYYTETLGVKALAHHLETQFNKKEKIIETVFLDIPTGL